MRALILLLPITLLLAACGGSSDEPTQASDGGEVLRTIAISEKEFSISPAGVTLDRPGTYEFEVTNDGEMTHALEIDGHGIEEETEEMGAGSTATLRVTLSEEGSYELYCPIGDHAAQGMKGMVTVGSTAGAGSGTTTNGETETDEDETTTGERPGY